MPAKVAATGTITAATTDDTAKLIDIFHAESLAYGEANVSRLSRMLGLIAIGFGGIAGLATLLLAYHRTEVVFVAPFVLLVLWMSCIRILAEMTMASEYQRYYDRHLAELIDTPQHRFRSWQSSAPRRGTYSASNISIYGFLAVASLAGITWCVVRSVQIGGWIGWVLLGVWAVGVVIIVISALRLRALGRHVKADLDA